MKSTHIHISFIGIGATLGPLDPKSSTYTKSKQLIQGTQHSTKYLANVTSFSSFRNFLIHGRGWPTSAPLWACDPQQSLAPPARFPHVFCDERVVQLFGT